MLESDAACATGRDMGHLLTSCGSCHDELTRTMFYKPPALNGISYEIDLSSENAQALRSSLGRTSTMPAEHPAGPPDTCPSEAH